jgi:hypothetical protein
MFEGLQFETGCAPEFGVELQHLDCERDLVHHALSGSVATRKQFEIVDRIVLAVAVFVVDCFVIVQFAAKMFRHYVAMFQHLVFFTGDERRDRNPNVAVALDVPSVISRIKFSEGALFYKFMSATRAAVFLFSVKAASWLARLRQCFIAVDAGKGISFVGIFTTACSRALSSAVQRVSTVFFVVLVQVRSHHTKRVTAFFACKFFKFATRCRDVIFESKSGSAFQSTETLVRARVTEEGLPAIFTRFLKWHSEAPVFSDQGSLTMSFGIVK